MEDEGRQNSMLKFDDAIFPCACSILGPIFQAISISRKVMRPNSWIDTCRWLESTTRPIRKGQIPWVPGIKTSFAPEKIWKDMKRCSKRCFTLRISCVLFFYRFLWVVQMNNESFAEGQVLWGCLCPESRGSLEGEGEQEQTLFLGIWI
jgi:hypothetical protein